MMYLVLYNIFEMYNNIQVFKKANKNIATRINFDISITTIDISIFLFGLYHSSDNRYLFFFVSCFLGLWSE